MKKNRPMFDPKRAFSWSAIASFEWNRDQWYRKYVLKEIPEVTPELEFGKYVDEKIQEDDTFLPHLVRYPVFQHKMETMFHDIPLIGIADAYRPPKNPALRDYKTGRKPWDQKRANETGQLTMYALMLYLIDGIKPEEIDLYIDWLPTHYKDGKIAFIEEDHTKLKPVTFRTKRTMRDILAFGNRINDTYAAMVEYCQKRPVLDTSNWDEWNAS